MICTVLSHRAAVFGLTINRGQHDSGVVVSDDVCIAVLGLVDL